MCVCVSVSSTTTTTTMDALLNSVTVSPYMAELPEELFDQVIKRLPLLDFITRVNVLMFLRNDNVYWMKMALNLAKDVLKICESEIIYKKDTQMLVWRE